MKRKIIIVFIILIVVTLASTYIFSFLHKVEVKTNPRQSDTRLNSKNDSIYISDYVPNKNRIKLKLRQGYIDLDTSWVEYAWYFEPNNFETTKERMKVDWFNLCLKVKANNTSGFVWSFEFQKKNIGTIGGYDLMNNQQESTLNIIPDTLVIFIEEKNLQEDIGWKKPVVTDTIIYVKHIDQ